MGGDRVRRTLRDGQGRAPLVPQDIQTDTAVGVDVGVVDAGGEVNLGRLEWVVGREVNGEEEDASRVWRVTLPREVSGWFLNMPDRSLRRSVEKIDSQDP